MEFKEAVKTRRSVRKFDPEKPIDTEIVKQCLELATLAPNSSNMQLWEFYHVTSPDKLKKLSAFCFDQNAAKTARQMVVLVTRKDLWKKRVQTHMDHMEASFGKKKKEEYTSRQRFAFTYYKKIVPLTYADFFGLLGWLKYWAYWIIGLFRPIYRQARNSDMRVVVHKSQALAAQTFMLAMTDAGYDTCPMEGSDTLRIKKLLGLPIGAEINMVIACGIRLPEGVYGERFRLPFKEVYKRV
jgi:nitroreductase